MIRFTFSINPWSPRRYSVVAENIDDAKNILWESLSQRQRDNVDFIECVSKRPATQEEYDFQFKNFEINASKMKTEIEQIQDLLPTKLFEDSKDWREGNVVERVEWLLSMYDSAKHVIESLKK